MCYVLGMSDPLQPLYHSERQPSFQELRDEYREQNRQRIRAMLRKDHLTRYHKDGSIAGSLDTGLMTTATGEWKTVKDYLRSNSIPDFEEDFRVEIGKGLGKELHDLVRDVELLDKSDRVERPQSTVERGVLRDLSDESVLAYMDAQRKESDGSSEDNPESKRPRADESEDRHSTEDPGD